MTTVTDSPPLVAVLLATCNGAACLQEQLDSYLVQILPPVLILISDDGSTDATREIVQRFIAAHPALDVRLTAGPQRGVAQNFLSLLRQVPDWIDVVALSDQDDVWLADKVQRGVQALCARHDGEEPVLYCGRTWECDADLGNRRISQLRPQAPCFVHALVQNIAGGNTMMLNRAALTLLQAASVEARKIVVHDWWIYQLVTGAGGRVIYDTEPFLLYRQHPHNMIGASYGFAAKQKRLRFLMSGRVRRWNTINIDALSASCHRLTPQNRRLLEQFEVGRNGSIFGRFRMLRQTGIFRQGLEGRLALYMALLLRRL